MVSYYLESPESVKEWEKIGLPYPSDMSDDHYEEFLEETKKSPKDKSKVEIRTMRRVVLGDSSQHIVYGQEEIRLDKIGNVRQWYRGSIGRYPIPTPYYEIKVNQETLEKERVCAAVSNIKTGYSIKFSAKMVDELHKLCVDEPSEYSNNQVTSYSVQRGDNKGPGNLVSIKSYKDWRDAEDSEELFRFGHFANPEERQLLAEEKAGRATPPNMIPRPYG
jgi:hypothetical protein